MKLRLKDREREPGYVYIDTAAPPSTIERFMNPPSGPAPRIAEQALVHDSILGPWTAVGDRSYLSEVTFGAWSYVVTDASAVYADIGKFCSIAQGARINPGNHPHWRAAMHHFSYRAKSYELADEDYEPFFEWRRTDKVTLGHDVWCGHGVVILPGRSVGTGSVVAAGAVVTKDVPPFTIIGGVPAEPIRERFGRRVQDALMDIAWWEWDHAKLKSHLVDFQTLDADAFVEKHR